MKQSQTTFIARCAFPACILAATIATPVRAQLFDLPWWTVDCGGGTTSGGVFILRSAVGQPDGGQMAGGTFVLSGGYWTAPNTAACYADCDGVGGLTGNDFQCFLNAYVSGVSYANCDGVGGLTANDFQCFLNRFVAGCS